MTPTEKLKRVANLCTELQDEDNEAIVTSRIEALAKGLSISPYQCAMIFWAFKMRGEFQSLFGSDVKVRFRAR